MIHLNGQEFLATNDTLSATLLPIAAAGGWTLKLGFYLPVLPASDDFVISFAANGLLSHLKYSCNSSGQSTVASGNDAGATVSKGAGDFGLIGAGFHSLVLSRIASSGNLVIWLDDVASGVGLSATNAFDSDLDLCYIGRSIGGGEACNAYIGGLQYWPTLLSGADRLAMAEDFASPIVFYSTTSTPSIASNSAVEVSFKDSLTAETGTVKWDIGKQPTFVDDSDIYTGEVGYTWTAPAIQSVPTVRNGHLLNRSLFKNFIPAGDSVSVDRHEARWPLHFLNRYLELTGLQLERLVFGLSTATAANGNYARWITSTPDTETWTGVTNQQYELQDTPVYFGFPSRLIYEMNTGAGPFTGSPQEIGRVELRNLTDFASRPLGSWVDDMDSTFLYRKTTVNQLAGISQRDHNVGTVDDLVLFLGDLGEIRGTGELRLETDVSGGREIVLISPALGFHDVNDAAKNLDAAGFVVTVVNRLGGLTYAVMADDSYSYSNFGVDTDAGAGSTKDFDDDTYVAWRTTFLRPGDRDVVMVQCAGENRTQSEYETDFGNIVTRELARASALGQAAPLIAFITPPMHRPTGSADIAAARVDCENQVLAADQIAQDNPTTVIAAHMYLASEGCHFHQDGGGEVAPNDANGPQEAFIASVNSDLGTTFTRVMLDGSSLHLADFDAAEYFGGRVVGDLLFANSIVGSSLAGASHGVSGSIAGPITNPVVGTTGHY